MLSAAERLIAFRYLRDRRGDGFISVIAGFSLIGIALGVMTLIVVTSVMNGVRQEMLQHFIGFTGHVMVYPNGAPLTDYDQLAAEIAAQPGVRSAIPLVQGQAMVVSPGNSGGAQVIGFPSASLNKKQHLVDNLESDTLSALRRGEGAVIGTGMARDLNIRPGQSLTLISPQGRATIAGFIPRMQTYPVVGTFEFGMPSMDSNMVLLPFEDAQLFFKLASGEEFRAASAIEITLEDADAAPGFADRLQRHYGGTVLALPWQRQHQSVFQALTVQRNVMFMILTMIILVAAFNIISSLILLVKDKQSSIAILRTMGLSRAGIGRIFMFCGTAIGMIGNLIGLALGVLIASNTDAIRLFIERVTGQPLLGGQLYFLASLPARINWGEVLAILAMATLLSFIATIYPARRAAALEPAEALRHG